MPWELEWTEHTIHVRVSSPVPPVRDILREIANRSGAGTYAVYLPTSIPGDSEEDERFIRELWQAVTDSGRVARRSSEVEDPSA